MIAAIYARKSTDQTGVADEARSVARQIDHAREYAARKGWSVADEHVYVDDGISGAEFATRPGFVRLMNSLKPRAAFQVLVMSEESRLGREAIETSYALKQLLQAGVRVFFYLEDRERTLGSPTDKLLLSVQSFADELEREKARQRTYDALARKARAGHVTGGRVFGYDNVTIVGPSGERSHVERRVNDEQAAVVRRIFELYAGGSGFASIAKTLNDERALCPRAQQGRPDGWAPSSVREVLYRPLYVGRVVWNQTRKRDTWGRKRRTDKPANEHFAADRPDLRIVSDALWLAAHRRLDEVRGRALRVQGGRLIGRPPASAAKYLLSGLLRCASCGSTMEVRTSGRKGHVERIAHLGCGGYAKRGRAVCANSLLVPMASAESVILDAVESSVLDPDVISEAVARAARVLESDRPARRLADVEDALRRLDGETARLSSAIAAGGDLAALVTALREREGQRRALRVEREALAAAPTAAMLTGAALRDDLRRRLDDWRGLLRRQPAQGQQILRRLIVGRLDCTPQPERYYRVTGTATFSKLFEGVLPPMVASPAGVEPASPP
jgi:site-specific DNA recombinase